MSTTRKRLAKLIKTDGNGLSPSVCDLISELLAELDAKCRWRRHKELGSKLPLWFTECGEQSVGVFKHCPHCGKEIVSE